MSTSQGSSGGEPPAIEASGLVKRFGAVVAVDGLDLLVPRGGVFGLLGPNGAGKTTAVRVLATLVPPDAGSARVLGHDLVADGDAVRSRIALTGQYASVDNDLTGRENLVLLARLLGHDPAGARRRADDLLEAFDLTGAAGRLAKTWSGGMRRRLDIAASIVVTPDLLFLDEPTTGLDPRSRHDVWRIVLRLVGRGTTVVLTTQHLDEADALADRVAVVDRGRVVAEGTTADLKASVGAGTLRVRVAEPAQRGLAAALLAESLGAPAPSAGPAGTAAGRGTAAGAGGGGVDAAEADASTPVAAGVEAGMLVVPVDGVEAAHRAVGELLAGGVAVAEVSVGQPTLDEAFLALTGGPPTGPPTEPPTERSAA